MLSQIGYRKMTFIAIGVSLASIIVAPVVGQTVSVTNCFTKGPSGASNCVDFVKAFCKDSDVAEAIGIGNSVAGCFNAPPGIDLKCTFTSWNGFGTAALVPDVDNCEASLDAVITECPMGGSGSTGGPFMWTIDVSGGSCGADVTA